MKGEETIERISIDIEVGKYFELCSAKIVIFKH